MVILPSKKIIGRRESASLPEFNLNSVEVKIDTGAYSCSIHCSSIKEQNNVLHVVFLDEKHPQFNSNIYTFSKFTKKKVKSSSGHVQERYFIKTFIQLGDKTYQTDFSLTKRSGMRYPILLGRKLLNKNFIIDTSHKYLLK
jgi:hypothetical protein